MFSRQMKSLILHSFISLFSNKIEQSFESQNFEKSFTKRFKKSEVK